MIGVSVVGLEPEFQPVVNYLLPHIISHKQDAHDMHLQVGHIVNSNIIIRAFLTSPPHFICEIRITPCFRNRSVLLLACVGILKNYFETGDKVKGLL